MFRCLVSEMLKDFKAYMDINILIDILIVDNYAFTQNLKEIILRNSICFYLIVPQWQPLKVIAKRQNQNVNIYSQDTEHLIRTMIFYLTF